MIKISSIFDIQKLIKRGFDDWRTLGNVSIAKQGNLRLFNYTPAAQFEARWNFFERVSRGLIIDAKTGEVAARPFDKFFNWGEGERYTTAPIQTVTEKADGSLGVLYRQNGRHCIATRGSFESEQALWATKFLHKNHDLSSLPEEITLLFEIIYPENRIIVDYQGLEDLVLLAARNRMTGQHYAWKAVSALADEYFFSLPIVYEFDTPEQVARACISLDANFEGWVVEFQDGQRFKFKGEEYRKLHKLLSGLSFKKVLEYMANGTLDVLLSVVPDEFMEEVESWVQDIESTVDSTKSEIDHLFEMAPKGSRKEFALWVIENHKTLAHYLFARLDGKPLDSLIYKTVFKQQCN